MVSLVMERMDIKPISTILLLRYARHSFDIYAITKSGPVDIRPEDMEVAISLWLLREASNGVIGKKKLVH
jgi:hypothetical protein